MPPLFCSFHAGPGYAEEARGLAESLDALGLPHVIRALPDAGAWELNCGRKPVFLLDVAREHPDRPLVWLDADARVVQAPTLFDSLECDVACHYRHGEELLSGTLYFGGTDGAIDLLNEWASECQRNPNEWDQRVLQAILADRPHRWRVQTLPAEYVRIFDADDMGEAVILHRQASRRLKR